MREIEWKDLMGILAFGTSILGIVLIMHLMGPQEGKLTPAQKAHEKSEFIKKLEQEGKSGR